MTAMTGLTNVVPPDLRSLDLDPSTALLAIGVGVAAR
jgi:hypothetical protein